MKTEQDLIDGMFRDLRHARETIMPEDHTAHAMSLRQDIRDAESKLTQLEALHAEPREGVV